MQNCLVPASFRANVNASKRFDGLLGSGLAHLRLLHRLWLLQEGRRADAAKTSDGSCAAAEWALVMADDVVLLPRFRWWLERQMRYVGPGADLVNLAVVRAWGDPGPTFFYGAMRTDGNLMWKYWKTPTSGSPYRQLKSPNLQLSAYLVRLSRVETLLWAFGTTVGWKRSCSTDLVLSRIEYALASAGRYTSYNIDAEDSRVRHCAVGPEERALWAASKDGNVREHHAACLKYHPQLYGRGSRSQTANARPVLTAKPSEKPRKQDARRAAAALRTVNDGSHDLAGDTCSHGFRVPYDRVAFLRHGPMTLPPAEAALLAPRMDEAAWAACARSGPAW